jgi:hypothetical protein
MHRSSLALFSGSFVDNNGTLLAVQWYVVYLVLHPAAKNTINTYSLGGKTIVKKKNVYIFIFLN